jgi:hypothetical protein
MDSKEKIDSQNFLPASPLPSSPVVQEKGNSSAAVQSPLNELDTASTITLPSAPSMPQMVTAPPKSKKLLIAIIIIIIGLVIVGIGIAASFLLPKTVIGSLPINKVKIVYVTVKTHVDEQNNTMGDTAATANGHYAYIDASSGGVQDSTNDVATINYDGKIVYTGKDIVKDNIVISLNGLHYGYILDDGTNYSIYIDGKKLNTLSNSNNLTLDGVSNDGKKYAYNYDGNDAGLTVEYVNGTNFYTPQTGTIDAPDSRLSSRSTSNLTSSNYFKTLQLSENLDSFVGLSTDIQSDSFIYNGKAQKLNVRQGRGVLDYGISQNGLHNYVLGVNSIIISSTPTVSNPPKVSTSPTSTPLAPTKQCFVTPVTVCSGSSSKYELKTSSYSQLFVNGKSILKTEGIPGTSTSSYQTIEYSPTGSLEASIIISSPGINNNGDYYYINNKDSNLVINNNKYKLSSNNINTKQGSLGHEIAAINNDASHYIAGNSDTRYWNLDGKNIGLDGDIFGVELVNNTLYAYRWEN